MHLNMFEHIYFNLKELAWNIHLDNQLHILVNYHITKYQLDKHLHIVDLYLYFKC